MNTIVEDRRYKYRFQERVWVGFIPSSPVPTPSLPKPFLIGSRTRSSFESKSGLYGDEHESVWPENKSEQLHTFDNKRTGVIVSTEAADGPVDKAVSTVGKLVLGPLSPISMRSKTLAIISTAVSVEDSVSTDGNIVLMPPLLNTMRSTAVANRRSVQMAICLQPAICRSVRTILGKRLGETLTLIFWHNSSPTTPEQKEVKPPAASTVSTRLCTAKMVNLGDNQKHVNHTLNGIDHGKKRLDTGTVLCRNICPPLNIFSQPPLIAGAACDKVAGAYSRARRCTIPVPDPRYSKG
ncbi:hypothetical protein FPV67DRAFT_1682684 [Lyophyllum atratum]|nr:hypothetical protein FPV67DRAFT_1682684 [Lyophyllum atratum]